MTDMQIESRESDGVAHVALAGELDLATAPGVEEALRRAESGRPPVMVLDLSGLRFLDSTGLRIVLSADSRARREGRRLVLVRGPESVHRVFRIALLDRRLEFVEDVSALGDGSGQ